MQTIQSLSFDDIKSAFIEYIKSTNEFKDYNFKASGISSLINLLAYNTHFLGYYVKMMLNETFIDSARLRESMLSNAKLVGYVPRSVKSSVAELFVKVSFSADPTDMKVTIPRGTTFTATTSGNLKKSFVSVDDFTLYNRVVDGSDIIYKNTVDPITPLVVKEGEFKAWNFKVDPTIVDQRFLIKQANVDYDTIRVRVYDTEGSVDFKNYTLATFNSSITKDSLVFYISTNENGYYEIFFGNDVFGKSVTAGNKIEVSYIVSSGEAGNGAGTLGTWSVESSVNGRPLQIDLTPYPTYAVDVIKPISSGGMNEETVESMRFTIPHHFRRQNRIVTVDDYRSVILSEYRNVESISVWGGEDAYRKEYGKVFISIKPKYSDALTQTAKQEISNNILNKYGVVGIDAVFVDPQFIRINMDVRASYDKTKTNYSKGEIETIILKAIREYDSNTLNVFESSYSEVDILQHVKSQESSIKSLYTYKTISKDVKVKYVNQSEIEMIFGNTIKPGITTNTFMYDSKVASITDIDGKLYVVLDASKTTKLIAQNIGTVDYELGVLTFKPPKVLKMIGSSDFTSYGVLTVTVTPVAPDISTYMNNIIRINQIKVTVNA